MGGEGDNDKTGLTAIIDPVTYIFGGETGSWINPADNLLANTTNNIWKSLNGEQGWFENKTWFGDTDSNVNSWLRKNTEGKYYKKWDKYNADQQTKKAAQIKELNKSIYGTSTTTTTPTTTTKIPSTASNIYTKSPTTSATIGNTTTSLPNASKSNAFGNASRKTSTANDDYLTSILSG